MDLADQIVRDKHRKTYRLLGTNLGKLLEQEKNGRLAPYEIQICTCL
jgi:hypothetical protein